MTYIFAVAPKFAVVEVPENASASDWTENLLRFSRLCRREGAWVLTVHLNPVNRAACVYFTYGLAPGGACFTLVAMPGVTAEMLKGAKQQLRRERDVVSITVLRVTKTVEFNWETT